MENLTAVDWLVNELNKKQNGDGSSLSYNQIFDQAKAMEKEQIENAYDQMRCVGNYESGKQYYNETFKSE
jgi:hypothetical protein